MSTWHRSAASSATPPRSSGPFAASGTPPMPDRSDLTVPIRALYAPKQPVKGSSVTARAVLTGCIVALVSVFVTALIAVPLAAQAAERSARESLATQAASVAAVLRVRPAAAKRQPDETPI